MILVRLFNWFVNYFGARTLVSLLLLIIALSSVSWTVADEVRGLGLGLLLPITFFGLLLGWIFAKFRPLPGWLAALLIIIIGAEAIVVRISGLDRPLLALGRHMPVLAWQIWRLPWDGLPDFEPIFPITSELWLGIVTLLNRLGGWFAALIIGLPSYDLVTATLVWSMTIWLICAWAGWMVRRHEQPLAALAPAGALLATLLAYRPNQAANLLPLLAATLLLMGLTGHFTREKRWLSSGTDFSYDIRTDLGFTVAALTTVIVATAAFTPSISIRQITDFANRRLTNQAAQAAEPVADSLGLESEPEELDTPLKEVFAPGLPRSHLLGSGPELSEQVALLINTGQVPIPYEAGEDYSAPRRYWRSLTYDSYSGRGWRTRQTGSVAYAAGELATEVTTTTHRILRQTVQTKTSQGDRIHAAGTLVTADHDFNIDWRGTDDFFAAIIEANTYQVDSMIPIKTFTEDELRSAGTEYPAWIIDRYLDLPESTPERVLGLAFELTATAPTPFDGAKAIETHLRTFPYNLELPEPPLGRDVVDYFLFDLQEGYCDYYATSMVVMARASGLPARLAVGYASGTYDQATANYIVTEADAHSWVEIYFPGYGWVNFEPTAAQPITDRSIDTTPLEPLDPLPPLASAVPQTLFSDVDWWWFIPGGMVLILAGSLLWSLADRWRLGRLGPDAAVTTLYERLQGQGRRLAVPVWRGETPYEFADLLTVRIENLVKGKRWAAVIRPSAQEVKWLTNLYVRTVYSTHWPNLGDQAKAIQTWRRLHRRLWVVRLSVLLAGVRKRR